MSRRVQMAERFWSRVDKSGECWEWTARTSGGGYGAIGLPGSNNGRRRYLGARTSEVMSNV